MPGNKCQYFNCYKNTIKYPGLSMFRFPKDRIISETWAINSGNVSLLSLDVEKLYSRYICQEHFSPDDFIYMYDKKKKLKPKAVPFKFNSLDENQPSMSSADEDDLTLLTPTKTYNKYKTSTEVELIFSSPNSIMSTPQKEKISDLIDMPSPSFKRKHSYDKDPDTPRKIKLKQKIEKKSKIIHNKNSHISKLKNYASKFKVQNNLKNLINAYQFPSCNSRALVTMQLKTKRRTWTTAERNLAFTFFYKSPTAYNFIRLQKINLPAPSTIRRWIGESKFLPGFNNYFFDHIQKKFEHTNYKEKECSICFDEMYIKEFLEYSKQYDFIEGFQDLGTYGRMNKTANCVLVFLARGIYSQWKFPIAYYLSNSGVNKEILKNLIVDILNKLFDIGLSPKLIVCDQGTSNQRGYNKNPTSRTIRTSIRSSCIFSLCASTATNCEPLQDTNDFISIDVNKISTNTETIETYSDDESSISSSSSADNKFKCVDKIQTDIVTVTLEDCSVTYFAGYLIYKCYKQFNCHHCQNNLQTNKNLNDKNQSRRVHRSLHTCSVHRSV
ncbi:uncharacterized protein LOC132924740 [Rhopalosiphum padi]|uniref:uncharacterized protein LOC132924740 n=1 Tax=Rhopalosiphum padi TaxID=40932 RepID=UPI00298EAAA8|nr:uncharacterized protein LOC132924740 [Rhopalosiphum padi]